MNKKNLFEKSAETTAHGSIRTSKRFKGAVATLALAGSVVVVGGGVASADEVTAPVAPPTEVVTQPVAAQPTVEAVQPAASAPVVTESPVAPVAETQPVVSTPQESSVVASTDVPKVTNAAVDVVTTTNGSTTTVDTTERQDAVTEAKNAGVRVTTEDTVNLGTASTVAEETELQNQAKAAIDKETAAVEAKIEDYTKYKSDLVTYKKELAEAIEKASVSSSSFGEDAIREFLNSATDNGDSIRVLNSSIIDKRKTTYDHSGLEKVTNINDVLKDFSDGGIGYTEGSGLYRYFENDGNYDGEGALYKLHVGDKFSYTGLFGDEVVTTFTVKDFKPAKADGVDYLLTAIRYEVPSFDIFGGGEPKIDVSFTDKNGNPLKGDYIVGFGDVDSNQAVKLSTTPSAEILGSSIRKLENNTYISDISASENASEPEHQVWFMFNDVSNFEYTYGFDEEFATENGKDNTDWTLSYTSFWHEIGGIDFGFTPPIPPVTVNPAATVNTYTYNTVGDVTTVHVSEDGTILIPKATKVDNGATGTSYDVSAHENKIVTKDGRTFKFVSVTDNAKGNIKDGIIDVVFTYEEVYGDVTVTYVDKDGNVIKNPVTDTPLTSTGKDYSTVDNKPTIIEHDGDKYIIIPNLTKGEEEGKVKEGNTTVTYVYNKLEATKGVTNDKGDNIDNGVLNIGGKGSYSLTGASVLASIFQDGKGQYAFEDDLNEKHDKLLLSELILVKGITLEDGTVIKSGADLIKYAQESYDGNIYKVSLNSDFLKSIADDQELQVQAILDFERIAAGEVTNTFKNIINGEVVESNTVKTTTPEPAKPVTPSQPAQPTSNVVENVPVAAAAALPSTGEKGSALLTALGMMSIISVAIVARKKKQI